MSQAPAADLKRRMDNLQFEMHDIQRQMQNLASQGQHPGKASLDGAEQGGAALSDVHLLKQRVLEGSTMPVDTMGSLFDCVYTDSFGDSGFGLHSTLDGGRQLDDLMFAQRPLPTTSTVDTPLFENVSASKLISGSLQLRRQGGWPAGNGLETANNGMPMGAAPSAPQPAAADGLAPGMLQSMVPRLFGRSGTPIEAAAPQEGGNLFGHLGLGGSEPAGLASTGLGAAAMALGGPQALEMLLQAQQAAQGSQGAGNTQDLQALASLLAELKQLNVAEPQAAGAQFGNGGMMPTQLGGAAMHPQQLAPGEIAPQAQPQYAPQLAGLQPGGLQAGGLNLSHAAGLGQQTSAAAAVRRAQRPMGQLQTADVMALQHMAPRDLLYNAAQAQAQAQALDSVHMLRQPAGSVLDSYGGMGGMQRMVPGAQGMAFGGQPQHVAQQLMMMGGPAAQQHVLQGNGGGLMMQAGGGAALRPMAVNALPTWQQQAAHAPAQAQVYMLPNGRQQVVMPGGLQVAGGVGGALSPAQQPLLFVDQNGHLVSAAGPQMVLQQQAQPMGVPLMLQPMHVGGLPMGAAMMRPGMRGMRLGDKLNKSNSMGRGTGGRKADLSALASASLAGLLPAATLPKPSRSAAEAAAAESLNATAGATEEEHEALMAFLARRVAARTERAAVLAESARAELALAAAANGASSFSSNFMRANAALQSAFGASVLQRLNRRPANAPRPAALPGTADSAEGEASGATAAGAADAASGDEAARCRLFVGNLLSSVDEEQLHDVFGLFGEVQELQIMWNTKLLVRGRLVNREFGFVSYTKPDAAAASIRHLNGYDMPGLSKDSTGLTVQYECKTSKGPAAGGSAANAGAPAGVSAQGQAPPAARW